MQQKLNKYNKAVQWFDIEKLRMSQKNKNFVNYCTKTSLNK